MHCFPKAVRQIIVRQNEQLFSSTFGPPRLDPVKNSRMGDWLAVIGQMHPRSHHLDLFHEITNHKIICRIIMRYKSKDPTERGKNTFIIAAGRRAGVPFRRGRAIPLPI